MNALSFALALGALGVPAAWLVSAATRVALPTVRRLVAVAQLRLLPNAGIAFGGSALERRVVRLLNGAEPPRPSRAGAGVALLAALAGLLLVVAHEPLHQQIEALWGHARPHR